MGNDCEFIYLADITSNSGCSNGQKFVLKGANNTRKQFLIVNDKAIIAFITKRKKFTACESFTDITTSVSCKTVSGLDNVPLPSSSSNSSSNSTGTATTAAASGAANTTAAAAANATTAAAASNTTAASNSSATTAEADDEVVTRVKGYIDAGTCGSISSSSSCGDSATSYYKEITYNGKRVVISNQVPDHDHENDQLTTNPNEACERYQFIELPLNPAKGSSATRTGLGTIGLAVTGGAFFNDWSSPSGDIALYNEGSSLDSCFGHSASGGAYHYHANINCSSAGAATGANDPDTCKLIGYYQDGVPVYGFCKDSAGMVMTSCYECTGTCTSSVTTVGGTYSGLGTVDTDYTYSDSAFAAGTCNLDSASGAVHPTTGEYSYFATVGYPWVPIYFYGDQGTSSLCSAA